MQPRRLHGLAAIALTLVACYDPRYGECIVRCTATSECAPNQICGSDGWCASAGVVGRCFQPGDGARWPDTGVPPADTGAPPIDARMPPIDARMPPADTAMPPIDAWIPPVDSAPPIDASVPDAPGPDCGNCPGNCQDGVCVISCIAARSCNYDVVCPASAPCRVECIGTESCWGTVFCGSGRCTVNCVGDRSCKRGVRCASACACDVACAGDDACKEKAVCPDKACRAEQGCTSQRSGCDDC